MGIEEADDFSLACDSDGVGDFGVSAGAVDEDGSHCCTEIMDCNWGELRPARKAVVRSAPRDSLAIWRGILNLERETRIELATFSLGNG